MPGLLGVSNTMPVLASLHKKAREAKALWRGKQIEELLVDCLGPTADPVWKGTPSAGPDEPTGRDDRMSQFHLGSEGVTLFRGRLDPKKRKHWYVGIPCAMSGLYGLHSKNLGRVYVVLPREDDWYGPKRLATEQERRDALAEDFHEIYGPGLASPAFAKLAVLCPEHSGQVQ